MTTTDTGFGLIIKTNSYAGNFEREICAFLTGIVGECEVGDEFVDVLPNKPDFSNIKQVSDDNGCYRPVSIAQSSSNDVVIFFDTRPTQEQIAFIKKHAPAFDHAQKITGRMAEYRKNDPVIEIIGFALESYNATVEQLTI